MVQFFLGGEVIWYSGVVGGLRGRVCYVSHSLVSTCTDYKVPNRGVEYSVRVANHQIVREVLKDQSVFFVMEDYSF